jgi:hypothetical protein
MIACVDCLSGLGVRGEDGVSRRKWAWRWLAIWRRFIGWYGVEVLPGVVRSLTVNRMEGREN